MPLYIACDCHGHSFRAQNFRKQLQKIRRLLRICLRIRGVLCDSGTGTMSPEVSFPCIFSATTARKYLTQRKTRRGHSESPHIGRLAHASSISFGFHDRRIQVLQPMYNTFVFPFLFLEMTDSREVHFSWTIAEWRLRSWQQLKRSMLCRKLCSELCSFVARWTEARYVVGNSNATWKYCSIMFVCSCIPLCISNVTYESGFFPSPRRLRSWKFCLHFSVYSV